MSNRGYTLSYPPKENSMPRSRIGARAPLHVRDWPAGESPQSKLLTRGATILSDAELLALMMDANLVDPVEAARRVLVDHGPLRKLLDQPTTNLSEIEALGPASAARMAAALELANRHLASTLERGEALTDPHAAGRYFAHRLRGHPSEVFAALFLDARHRALAFEELFHGTIDGTEVHPREVVRRALAHNAAAVIIGHNHPSGCSEPSAADRTVTARLKQALGLVDIRLLDHFVIGDGTPVSLAARGWV